MKVEPLSKELFDRLKAEGIETLKLMFQGGSDEGYLNIYAATKDGEEVEVYAGDLFGAVDTWVWSVYDYNGAGDGPDYGDNITYNLKTMKVTHEDWYQVEKYNPETSGDLEIAEAEEAEEEEAEEEADDGVKEHASFWWLQHKNTCGTMFGDVPDKEMTEKEFWRDVANCNGG